VPAWSVSNFLFARHPPAANTSVNTRRPVAVIGDSAVGAGFPTGTSARVFATARGTGSLTVVVDPERRPRPG
jgi:hypothetical protein